MDADLPRGGSFATRRRAPTDRADVPGWQRRRNAVEPIAIMSHRAKGGISVMAKKTAKGGKKKGGKKR